MTLAKYVNGLCGQEGERHSVTIGKRFAIVSESDYREDFGYVDPDAQTMLDESMMDDVEFRKDIARCALDTMPDVACSAIASTLNLKLHQVIALSNGRHNKAKRRGALKGVECAEVTLSELIENYRYQNSGN
jgi:hypothetical protein